MKQNFTSWTISLNSELNVPVDGPVLMPLIDHAPRLLDHGDIPFPNG